MTMTKRLQGKVAVVTGASKGIGAAIARHLAADGASVAVNFASDREGAEQVVADITKAGGKAVAVQGSVSKVGDVNHIFATTRKTYGNVDILVNNAGVYKFAPIDEFTESEYRRQFDTNVLGPYLSIKTALANFNPKGGSIINISSVASRENPATASIYSATKAALDSITSTLAKELGPKQIRVNAVSPGGVDTPGNHAAGVIGSDFQLNMIARTPLGRFGQPDDIALVVAFLASDEARWITGEKIFVSGGQ